MFLKLTCPLPTRHIFEKMVFFFPREKISLFPSVRCVEVPMQHVEKHVRSEVSRFYQVRESYRVRKDFSNIPLEHNPHPELRLYEGIPFIWGFGDAWGILLRRVLGTQHFRRIKYHRNPSGFKHFYCIFYDHPYMGKIPNVHSYFSDGLKPPTITRINRVPLVATPYIE